MLIVLCCVVCAFAWVAEVRDLILTSQAFNLGKSSVWAMGYFGCFVLCCVVLCCVVLCWLRCVVLVVLCCVVLCCVVFVVFVVLVVLVVL